MLAKFSLYDFIAVLIPGIFFLWTVETITNFQSLQRALPLTGSLSDTSILIVIGYVAGLLLQGMGQAWTERILLLWWGGFPSARWLMPNDRRLSHAYKEDLWRLIKRRFDIDNPESANAEVRLRRNQEVFYLCYRSVERMSDLPQTFVAQYGLFRSLLTTFAILTFGVLAKFILDAYRDHILDRQLMLLLVALLLGSHLSYSRTVKRGEDFAKAVYDVFIARFGSAEGDKPDGPSD